MKFLLVFICCFNLNAPILLLSGTNQDIVLSDEPPKKNGLKIILIISSLAAIKTALFFHFRFKKRKKQSEILAAPRPGLRIAFSKIKVLADVESLNLLMELAKRGDPTFFLKFNELHPEFSRKLRQKSSKLSLHDLEFCAYMKMNLSTKEIALFTRVTVRSAETRKYRIRKKLGLSSSENINLMMMEL